ncbi:hypothetical protein COMA1_20080 [Candidatus Nitrospira nitrosa]|uniref:Uncharacterized protein n=1 Tax=Candidatus Nitrospira nitrosa TaxID=1742972 RepID=A0A0S4LIM5_9BACT|nr:hypothetical protein COMA1_20080 [Candidatus Nitrospira nitrosa]
MPRWHSVQATVPGENPWTGSRSEVMGTSVVSGFQFVCGEVGSLPQKQACPVVALWQMI